MLLVLLVLLVVLLVLLVLLFVLAVLVLLVLLVLLGFRTVGSCGGRAASGVRTRLAGFGCHLPSFRAACWRHGPRRLGHDGYDPRRLILVGSATTRSSAQEGKECADGSLSPKKRRRAESRIWGVFIIAVHRAFVLGLGARHRGIVELSEDS
jgi:hypothetical protein